MIVEHFTEAHHWPFSVALVIMFLLMALQVLSMLFGLGVAEAADSILPDLEADLDADLGEASAGWLDGALGWLELGKVPFLVSLSLFLLLFSAFGFFLQSFISLTGFGFLPVWLAVPACVALALPPLKLANAAIGRIWPKDETVAVSPDRFVGRVATITLGEATRERSAEAKLKGPKGRWHYIMVLADGDEPLRQGSEVLLVSRQEAVFLAIPNSNPALKPHS